MFMLFKKKKNREEEFSSRTLDYNTLALQILSRLCQDGTLQDDAFVIDDEDIYVYADVISLDNNVAQVVFQMHHPWLEDPVIESVAASGDTREEALDLACENFYDHILSVFLMAIHHPNSYEQVEGFTTERHYFHVYRSKVNGLGKREGIMEGDFWDMLQDKIIARLGNKKAYWIKVFTSKNKNKVLCEVRINGKEASELSESLLAYAESWDCLGTYHTEKQCFLLIQDERSYEESDFAKDEIIEYTKKAIKLFEKCKSSEEHKKIRAQLIKQCKDDSLAYELFAFVPELYCTYAYAEVEFGDKLFLVQKDKKTRKLYQTQLQSFPYIEECIMDHLNNDDVSAETIQRVTAFSANARAIRKAVKEGDNLKDLLIPGIGYFAKADYILR